MDIHSTHNMFRTANEYLNRHEEDVDRAEQDETMKAILVSGTIIGFGTGLAVAGIVALALKIAKQF